MTTPLISVNIASLTLKNPVLVSSGTFGYGSELAELLDVNQLGGLITKAITPAPRAGNKPPRTIETPSGLLNAIGLENVGLDTFISEKIPYLETLDTAVIVNVAGSSHDDYIAVTERLDAEAGVAAFELNISCPNVREGGIAFGTDPASAAALTALVRKATSKPLIVKLSPNVTDITEIARAVCDAGADALSAVNTYRGMVIDTHTRKPVLGNVTGGLSGPAIRPLAVFAVWQLAAAVDVPIIGMGGISCTRDALEFLMAGATAVSTGTINFVHPRTCIQIADGIRGYCSENALESVQDIIGAARR